MSHPRQVFRQRDFSGGEIVPYAKRRDDLELVRASCRQLKNRRILAVGATEQRPGRSALFPGEARVDEVRMPPSTTYRLCFSAGVMRIRDSSGAVVTALGGLPWTAATVKDIRWALVEKSVYITFTDMKPIVATWDGSSTWTFTPFTFAAAVRSASATEEPFVRYAPLGTTMYPSGRTGSITLETSAAVFDASHVGAKFRWAEKQVIITAVTDSNTATATVIDELPPVYAYTFSATGSYPNGFAVGDAIEVTSTDNPPKPVGKGLIIGTDGSAWYILHTENYSVFGNLPIIGPRSRATINNNASPAASAWATTFWDEALNSDYRGWPQSVSADKNRLIFSDHPSRPDAIMWSEIGIPTDFGVGAAASDGICEFAPNNSRVYSVVGGFGDQFVLTDRGIYAIPISVSTPLVPGSVDFRLVSDDAADRVQPCVTSDGVLYASGGGKRVNAIVGTGQNARPYVVKEVSDLHSHLFSGVVALAATTAGADIAERYVYAINDDGTAAVGKLNAGKDWFGWLPWESGGDGTFSWASAMGDDALFCTLYGAHYLTEQIDVDAYLDAQVTLNSIPSALAAGTDSDILLPYWFGTRIGDMTAGSGLAAAFDGTTAGTSSTGTAAKAATTSAYVGKTLSEPWTIKKAIVYPSSDAGFSTAANITITLYGKQGTAPANATDGTSLGTTGSIADTTSAQTINSNDTTTEWDHVWVTLTAGSSTTQYVAEVLLYMSGLTRAAAGGGTGDLWFLESQTIDLMDGLTYMGDRAVEADGDVTAEEGDDLTVATLVTGFKWEEVIEPFIPHANEGQSAGQTMHKRSVANVAVTVQNSVGFVVRKTDDTELRRATPYRAGDNQDDDPTPREETFVVPISGADFDPRFEVARDVPGPNRILEISIETEV